MIRKVEEKIILCLSLVLLAGCSKYEKGDCIYIKYEIDKAAKKYKFIERRGGHIWVHDGKDAVAFYDDAWLSIIPCENID